MKEGGIFISYRPYDSSGRLRDHASFVRMLSHELADHFGAERVFIDPSMNPVDEYADEYPEQLRAKLVKCDVLLVVIHPEWVEDLQERRDKLGGGFDRVHYQISTVLNGDRHSEGRPTHRPAIIPVLLEKADLPKSAELPEDIRELALLQAFRLRFGFLTVDLIRLLTELEIHTIPYWPPYPAPDPMVQRNSAGYSGRAASGHPTSRGLVAVAFTASLIIFIPGSSWTSATDFLLLSAATITGTLLGAVATSLLGRGISWIESRVHPLPAEWLLIVRVGLVVMALILFLPPIVEQDQSLWFPFAFMASGLAPLFTVVATTHHIHADSSWPPRVSARPIMIRRAIARLEHHLTSLWHPPLSRVQREQAWLIVQQLDSAVAVLRKVAERTCTRPGWLRVGCPKLAIGYALWMATTLALAVASMYENSAITDPYGWYLSVSIGVVACALGVATMELLFRNDRKTWGRFFEEIEKNREDRIIYHISKYRTGRP